MGILSLISSYSLYRFSLHIHATFGEIYKSLFVSVEYRKKIDEYCQIVLEEIKEITGDSRLLDLPKREKYKIVWRYCHNDRIRIKNVNRLPSTIKPKKF